MNRSYKREERTAILMWLGSLVLAGLFIYLLTLIF